jgi:hypothetical protein
MNAILRSSSLLLLAALTIGGCKSGEDVSYKAIIHNLSPEMQGSVERPVDANRNLNLTHDMNARSFWDDLGRALYTDHPSRLSPLPISGTSGMPR